MFTFHRGSKVPNPQIQPTLDWKCSAKIPWSSKNTKPEFALLATVFVVFTLFYVWRKFWYEGPSLGSHLTHKPSRLEFLMKSTTRRTGRKTGAPEGAEHSPLQSAHRLAMHPWSEPGAVRPERGALQGLSGFRLLCLPRLLEGDPLWGPERIPEAVLQRSTAHMGHLLMSQQTPRNVPPRVCVQDKKIHSYDGDWSATGNCWFWTPGWQRRLCAKWFQRPRGPGHCFAKRYPGPCGTLESEWDWPLGTQQADPGVQEEERERARDRGPPVARAHGWAQEADEEEEGQTPCGRWPLSQELPAGWGVTTEGASWGVRPGLRVGLQEAKHELRWRERIRREWIVTRLRVHARCWCHRCPPAAAGGVCILCAVLQERRQGLREGCKNLSEKNVKIKNYTWGHWNKPVTKGQRLHDSTYIKFLG